MNDERMPPPQITSDQADQIIGMLTGIKRWCGWILYVFVLVLLSIWISIARLLEALRHAQ